MAIRIIARARGENAKSGLRTLTDAARKADGCRHAEDYASVEGPDQLLHLELWDTPAAWDEHQRHYQAAMADALDDIEFYKRARFAPEGPRWSAVDENARAETLRWPAPNGPIRIAVLVTAPVEAPAEFFVQNSIQTREEPGCREFEYFRSLDYAENLALIESWESPAIYDVHWRHRLAQNEPPPPPPPTPRYGEISFEWYPECRYALIDGLWQPRNPGLRMETVLW